MKITVRHKPTGQLGTLDENEFDPNVFERASNTDGLAPDQMSNRRSLQTITTGMNSPTPTVQPTVNQPLPPITATPQPTPNRGIMDMITDFIVPESKKFISNLSDRSAKGNKLSQDEVKQYLAAASNPVAALLQGNAKAKEIVKPALELTSMALPAGKGIKAAMGMGAASGALRGAGESDFTLPDIATRVGAGAAGGAAGGALMSGIAKILEKGGKGTAKRLMNSVFKEPLKETRSALSKGGESLGEQALRKGEVGGTEGLYTKALGRIQGLEDDLQNSLIDSPQVVNINSIKKVTAPLVAKYRQAGNNTAADAIESRIMGIEGANGANIPASAANEIKRSIYDEARNAYGTEASANMEGLKAIARGIKESLDNIPGVSQINKDLSYYGRTADSMADKLARGGRNNVLGLTQGVLAGGGLAAAPATMGLSLAPALAMGAMGSTVGKTGAAQALNKGGELAGNMLGSFPAVKTAQTLGGIAGAALPDITTSSPSSPVVPNTPNSNGPQNSQEYTSINNNHETIIPQNPANEAVDSNTYITGKSPEEIYAMIGEYEALGDVASVKYLEKKFKDEMDWQDRQLKQNKTAAPKKLTEKQQAYKSASLGASQALSALESGLASGKVATGIGQDIKAKIGEKTGGISDEQVQYRAKIGAVRTVLKNALLGAAMSERELESISPFIPEFNDAPNVAKQKLKTFVEMTELFSSGDVALPGAVTIEQ